MKRKGFISLTGLEIHPKKGNRVFAIFPTFYKATAKHHLSFNFDN